MSHLLHVDTSASENSVSRRLAAVFRAAWEAVCPTGTVTHRDLGAEAVPHLDADGLTTLMAEPRGERQRAASALHDELVAEFLAADALLISAPMHNWGVPSNLKAWLDQSLILGRTLPFDPAAKTFSGRSATVLLAYGGDYRPGSPNEGMDHCEPYLRTVLDGVLGYEVEFITALHTVAPLTSQDPELLERAAESVRQAEAAAASRARAVAGGLVRT